MSKTKLCMSCMSRVPAEAEACPHCNYDGTQENDSYALPIGARLGDNYVLGRAIDCDGEKITYIGFDLSAKTRIFVKEYMPLHGAVRNAETGEVTPKNGAEIHFKTGLSDFTEMFTSLKSLGACEGLVKTLDVVFQSNTAYAVQEFFSGVSFKNFVKRNEGKLTAEDCAELLSPVIDALALMHEKNMLHCGISPDTIKLNREGVVKIGGFCTPSMRTVGTEYSISLSDGFAAAEQYSSNTFLTPAADVYALAATIYFAVTGAVPCSADKRKEFDSLQSAGELAPNVPEHVSRALSAAMVLSPKERTQTLLELKGNLLNTVEYDSPSLPTEEPTKADVIEPASVSSPDVDDIDNEPLVPRWLKILTLVAAGSCVAMAIVYFSWQLVILNKQNQLPPPVEEPEVEYFVRNFVGQDVDELVLDDTYLYELTYVHSDEFEAGLIAEQSPVANSKYDKGKKVSLKISLGENRVLMPDFTNITPENVDAVLEELGIKLEYSIENQITADGIAGAIYKQSIIPGTEINPDIMAVILFVAERPPVL